MKRRRFNDEQIIRILKEHQAGMTAAELCHKHGISRECLTIVVDNSIAGARVALELNRIAERHGYLRQRHGTVSNAILKWQQDAKVEWHYIALGEPTSRRRFACLPGNDAKWNC